MALARGRRTARGVDYWPGFVDALSTLLLAIMFLLSVFVLAQFLLSREINGKDAVLDRLNSQINQLTQLLALEKSNNQDAQDQLANLQASLSDARKEKSRLQQLLAQGETGHCGVQVVAAAREVQVAAGLLAGKLHDPGLHLEEQVFDVRIVGEAGGAGLVQRLQGVPDPAGLG